MIYHWRVWCTPTKVTGNFLIKYVVYHTGEKYSAPLRILFWRQTNTYGRTRKLFTGCHSAACIINQDLLVTLSTTPDQTSRMFIASSEIAWPRGFGQCHLFSYTVSLDCNAMSFIIMNVPDCHLSLSHLF